MSCLICSAPVELYVRKNGYDILRCRQCGFGHTDVTQDQIAAFYNKAYFDGETASFGQEENVAVPPAHRFWIEQQLAHLPRNQPLRVLEIGPGLGGPIAGYFQRERQDCHYAAVEISDYASERLQARGLKVYTGRVSDPAIVDDCRNGYDLVFGTEVIEHDLDPTAFISAVYDILRPGGRAAFTTGNLQGWMSRLRKDDWYYLDPPAHVSFYTPRSARHVFTANGFQKVNVTRYGFRHIELKLKTRLPGLLPMVHLSNVSTGMTISAHHP